MEIDRLNDNRRVPITAIKTSPAKVVVKGKSKAFNPARAKNDTLQDLAVSVEFKPDPTNLQKLAAKQSTNKTEPDHNVELPTVSKRSPVKKPRAPRKPRAKVAEPVAPTASVQAANDSDKLGVEKRDRFSSLDSEPTVYLNAEQMDTADPARNINSDLNRFAQFNSNSNTRVESDEFLPAVIHVAPNKSYTHGEESVRINGTQPGVFERDFINILNNPYTSIQLNMHPQASKRGSFTIK
jgi:hypothetical protein